MRRVLLGLFALIWVASASAAAGPASRPGPRLKPELMEELDGRKLPKNEQWPANDNALRRRPWVLPDDHGGTLVIENLKIHHVTNQKGIFVSFSSPDKKSGKEGEISTFGKLIIRNVEISDVWRDEAGQAKGLHMDFILINDAKEVPFKPEIVLEDVYLHDGDALPLLIKDGIWSRVTLRRVKVENVTTSVRINAWGEQSSIDEIVIEDCPDINVSLSGDPGRIKKAIVRNSPGAKVEDVRDKDGNTPGTKIVIEDTPASAPVDPPAAPKADAKELLSRIDAVEKKLGDLQAEVGKLKAAVGKSE